MATWTEIHTSPIAQDKAQPTSILVWHALQGAMVVPREQYASNRLFLCWMEIPDGWISTDARLPVAGDADQQSCVIALERWGEIRMIERHQVRSGSHFTEWMPPPDPPENYQRMRKEAT